MVVFMIVMKSVSFVPQLEETGLSGDVTNPLKAKK